MRTPTKPEPGWLIKQVEATLKEAETWPAWMKAEVRIRNDYDSRRDAGGNKK